MAESQKKNPQKKHALPTRTREEEEEDEDEEDEEEQSSATKKDKKTEPVEQIRKRRVTVPVRSFLPCCSFSSSP